MVTYHFPPDAAVGGLRVQKFCKYLPESGWSVDVVTVREKYYETRDLTRLDDIGGSRVFRTRQLPNPWSVILGMRVAILRRMGFEAWLDRRERSARRLSFEAAQARGSTLKRLLLALCWLPDGQLGWLPAGAAQGLVVCWRYGIDAIVTSCFPERIQVMLERAVVRRADRVIVVNERPGNQYRASYERQRSKIVTVWNGYDPADFSRHQSGKLDSKFTIVHVGTLYFKRSAAAVLQAVARLIGEHGIAASDIRVVFVGAMESGLDVGDMVDALGLSDVVMCTGAVAYATAIDWMRRADRIERHAGTAGAEAVVNKGNASVVVRTRGSPMLGCPCWVDLRPRQNRQTASTPICASRSAVGPICATRDDTWDTPGRGERCGS